MFADMLLFAPIGRGRPTARPDLLHQRTRAGRRNHAIDAREVPGTPVARIVHHVHGVALIDEVIGPSWPSVRRLLESVSSLTASAGYQHDWIGMANVPRHPNLHIHCAVHGFIYGLAHVMSAHV